MHEPEQVVAGVWIDHAKAVIVTLSPAGERIDVVESKVQWQRRRDNSTVSRVREPRPADDQRTRSFVGHLNVYYDQVIARLRDANRVLIFGPGLAKGELKRRLDRNKIDERVAALVSTSKMTRRQIVAKTRDYYDWPLSITLSEGGETEGS